MKLKKIILSIICFIGLSGIIASIYCSLIIIVNIFLYGSLRISESNILLLTIELIWAFFGFISLPIVIHYTVKALLKGD